MSEEKEKPYHVEDPEKEEWVGSRLVGPNGFECYLSEPEDRSWYRDGKDVVDELNKLAAEKQELLDEIYDFMVTMRHLHIFPDGVVGRCRGCCKPILTKTTILDPEYHEKGCPMADMGRLYLKVGGKFKSD